MKLERRDTHHTVGDVEDKDVDEFFDIELEIKNQQANGDVRTSANGEIKIAHDSELPNGQFNQAYLSDRL